MSAPADESPDSANRGQGPSFAGPLKEIWDGERDPLAALCEGRPGPFEAFVQSESRRFLAFFDRLGAPRGEAEDLVQETFLKLFRLAAQSNSPAAGANSPAAGANSPAAGAKPSSGQAKPSGPSVGTLPEEESAQEARPSGYESQGRFLSFAFRVAKNAWIDRHRRSAYRPRLVGGTEDEGTPIDRAVSPDDGPAETATAGEEAARIRAAVRSLPDSHRLVFELGVIEERPYAEISEILSIPVGTVKSRMHNAVRKVRAVLERSTDASETPRARRTPR